MLTLHTSSEEEKILYLREFAQILVHSAVISNTVYLMQLLMIKELTRISMMNVEHGN